MWQFIIGILIIGAIYAAFKIDEPRGVEWEPLLFGKNWVDLVWIVLFALSLMNLAVLIAKDGEDLLFQAGVLVHAGIGGKVGLALLLVIRSSAQVYKLYPHTINLIVEVLLYLVIIGIASVPHIDSGATKDMFEQQIEEVGDAWQKARQAVAGSDPVDVSTATKEEQPYRQTEPTVNGIYKPDASFFYNPKLRKNLSGEEMTWCREKAQSGMNESQARACGYIVPSVEWCEGNREALTERGKKACGIGG